MSAGRFPDGADVAFRLVSRLANSRYSRLSWRSMKRKPFRQVIAIILLLAFYLLGSHAGAHGLAWCLGAEGHAHLEMSPSACDSSALQQPCGTAEACVASPLSHSPLSPHHAECRHLPVSSLHAPIVQKTLKAHHYSPQDSTLASLPPLWRLQDAAGRNFFRPPASSLPPSQALAALRTVVLLN